MDATVREDFWEYVCNATTFLYPFLFFGITILVLSLFSLLFVEPGTRAFLVLQIDLAVTILTLTMVCTMIVLCSRRVQSIE